MTNPGTPATSNADIIRVLHVDDEPDFADMVAEFLEREDDRFDVVTESTASGGLDRLVEEDVDCVVSDYDMPDTNGLEFLEVVREEYDELPFILFTGKGSEEIASEAISAGVTDYLQKESGTSQYAVLANRAANAVEKHRVERSLRLREERLETLLKRSSDAISIVDESGDARYHSPSIERQFGYDPEELSSEDMVEYVHPEDRDRVRETLAKVAADSEGTFSVEYRFRHRDGSWRWIQAVVSNQLDEPLVEGIIVNWRDVTKQIEYEQNLEETNHLLEAVIDASPAAILAYDRDGRLQLWNPAAERIYGWTAEEVVDEQLPMVPEEKRDEEEEIYERVFRGESIANLELRRKTKSGETIDISLSTAPIRDPDGEIIGNVSVAQDITERKEREHELEEMRQRIEMALSGTDSIIWERDVRTDSFERHGSVQKVYGHTSEGVGETMEDFYRMVHPEDREHVRDAMEAAVERGEEYRAEYRIQADEEIRWFRTQASVHTDDDGDAVRVIGLATDITELKNREEELARKTEQLDEFASVVTHDLRNPLTVAMGNVERIKRDRDGNPETEEYLGHVEKSLHRMGKIIENTLTLAQKGQVIDETELVDTSSIVERCWNTVETADATLLSEDLPPVVANPDRLRHLFENLFRNAVEHGGASVTVHVGSVENGLFVEDDGPGIADDERDRVFEAGYSKNEVGTGLGLPIVRRIVEAHGWQIRVGDGSEGGARFEITGITTGA